MGDAEKKRVGIFLIYDAEGIVDRYIIYLLKNICTCLDRLFIIVNGSIRDDELNKLRDISREVFFRENRGYDAGAFKDAILNIVGLDTLLQYDELTIFNDTFFGPFIPFRDIYSEMDDRKVDMWGLTHYEGSLTSSEHIQSYFLVFTRRLLHSTDFRDYWEELNGDMKTHDDLVREYETSISQTFRDKGYKLSTYVDDSKYDAGNATLSYNHYEHIGYQMLRYCKMPIMKKKKMGGEWKSYASYNDASKSIDYIRDNTNYDVSMIWENIIRVFSPRQLYHAMNLNYVLSTSFSDGPNEDLGKGVLIICYINTKPVLQDTVLHFLNGIPKNYRVCLITEGEGSRDWFSDFCHEDADNAMRILFSINDQETTDSVLEWLNNRIEESGLVCFINETLLSEENYLTQYMRTMNRWGNILNGRHFIDNVVKLFDAHERLGILLAPQIYYSQEYVWAYNHPWGTNYDTCKEVGESIGVGNLMERSQPFYDESGLWCRPDVARPLIQYLVKPNTDIKMMVDIKCVLAHLSVFVAKKLGYYSAVCESDENARISITNKNHMLERLCKQYGELFTDEGERFLFLDEMVVREGIVEYCRCFDSIYIYGMGTRGRHICEYLTFRDVNVNGFISSKSYELPERFMNRGTYYLTEVKDEVVSGEKGLIIAASKQFHAEITYEIQKCGIVEYKWI